jgi:YidC/Oxa1 family membrane protein insertase
LAELRNPNASTQGSGGGDNMRSMLAFTVLALVALFAFQYFKPTPAPATQPPPPQTMTQPAQGVGGQQATAGTPAVAATGTASAPAVAAAAESTTVVENDQYKITFTNRGALVKSWLLKHYKDSQGKDLDLVNQRAAVDFGFPLSLYTYEPTLTAQLNQALYVPSATGAVHAPAGISFTYQKDALKVTKTYLFNESYVIDVQVSVTRDGSPVRALVAWPSGLGDQEEVAQYNAGKFAWSIDGKHDSEAPGKISGNRTLEQPYEYAAAIDLYFAAAFLPSAPSRATVVTFHNQIDRYSASRLAIRAVQPIRGYLQDHCSLTCWHRLMRQGQVARRMERISSRSFSSAI